MKRWTWPRLAFLAAAWLVAWPCSAHRPVFVRAGEAAAEAPVRIEDPSISWAFYGELNEPGSRDIYRFRGRAGQSVLFGLLVPKKQAHEAFRPSVAIVGKGLPAQDLALLPIEPSPPFGALVLETALANPTTFFEPFTQVSYLSYPHTRAVTPIDATYFLVVWSPSTQTGPYVLTVGERDELAAADLMRLPGTWFSARSHADQPVWFGWLFASGLVGLAALGARRLGGRRPLREESERS